MYVVAVHRTDPTDATRATTLASILGVTAYDARSRVNIPGPCVVAQHQDIDVAKTQLLALRTGGFDTLARDTERIGRPELWFEAQTFALAEDGFEAHLPDGTRLEVPYTEVRALVRGMRVESHTTVETTTGRAFSAKRAVMTGGISSTRRTTNTETRTDDAHEGFLHLYARTRPVCVFRETWTRYDGLPNAQLTRAAGFLELVRELRARAPAVPYDDRLLRPIAQRQLLGTTPLACDLARLASAFVAGSIAAG
jgi:hypothetical protein